MALYKCKVEYEQWVDALCEDEAKTRFLVDVVPYNADVDVVSVEKVEVKCASCGVEIDAEEYEENGFPACYDCNAALCPMCLTRCGDENDRCPECYRQYKYRYDKESGGFFEN